MTYVLIYGITKHRRMVTCENLAAMFEMMLILFGKDREGRIKQVIEIISQGQFPDVEVEIFPEEKEYSARLFACGDR